MQVSNENSSVLDVINDISGYMEEVTSGKISKEEGVEKLSLSLSLESYF